MKSIGALPTEERVQKMNFHQWIWYYYNLLEDEKQTRKRTVDDLDFITWFIDPKLSKSVREERKKLEEEQESKSESKYKENNTLNGDEVINDSFEAEIAQYLNGADFVELPSASGVSSNETKEQFFDKAIAIKQYIENNPDDDTFNIIPIRMKNPHNLNYQDKTEQQILNENQDNDLDIIF